MPYPYTDPGARMGDPARTPADERRTFARRIDCDSAARGAADPYTVARATGRRDAMDRGRALRALDID